MDYTQQYYSQRRVDSQRRHEPHRQSYGHDPYRHNSKTPLHSRDSLPPKVIVTSQPRRSPSGRRGYRGGRRGASNRNNICLFLVIFVFLAAVGIGVGVYFATRDGGEGGGSSGSGSSADCQVVTFTSSITFTLMELSGYLTDKATDGYQDFVNTFCANLTTGLEKQIQLNECARQKTDHCTVTSLEKGSVKVNFEVRRVVKKSNMKSSSSLEREMNNAIEEVIQEGKDSSLSDNNIFKQRTTQAEVSVGETVELKQCLPFNIPENSKLLSSSLDTNLVGTTVTWACKDGYILPEGETITSATCGQNGYWSFYPNKDCLDVDECLSDPCLNSATCVNGENGYTCECSAAFTGVHCETKFDQCIPNVCLNGGNCTDLDNDYSCSCVTGFIGKSCETNFDDCESNPCQNNATCVDDIDRYNCECQDGIIGTHCETNVDECALNPCQNNATCEDVINGYICHCPAGYTGDECESEINECDSNPCKNGGTCTDELADYQCTCVPGWDNATDCNIEVDECMPNPCQNDASCTDKLNAFECACPTGFVSPDCSIACNSVPTEEFCLTFDLTGNSGFQTTASAAWADIIGGTTTASACGVKDKCGNFDGTDDCLEFGKYYGGYGSWNDITVGLWFKRNSGNSGVQGLFTNGECDSSMESLIITSDENKINAGIKSVNDDLLDAYVDIPADDDVWHHVVLVYDGTQVLLYLDNEIVTPTNAIETSGGLVAPGCKTNIGKSSGGGFFDGRMDEICLYLSGSLTQAQVSALYYQPQCPVIPEK